jgi:hypothetical protein
MLVDVCALSTNLVTQFKQLCLHVGASIWRLTWFDVKQAISATSKPGKIIKCYPRRSAMEFYLVVVFERPFYRQARKINSQVPLIFYFLFYQYLVVTTVVWMADATRIS